MGYTTELLAVFVLAVASLGLLGGLLSTFIRFLATQPEGLDAIRERYVRDLVDRSQYEEIRQGSHA